jgi:hypothetical protein
MGGGRGPGNVLSFDRNVNLAQLVEEVLPDHRVTTHPAEEVLVGPPEKGPDHWQRIHCEAAGSEQ